MKTVCNKDDCTGCMSCIEICPRNAITIVDTMISYNAKIDEKRCINCDMCRRVCQNNNPVNAYSPILWKQGWALDNIIRKNSSSGGLAQAIEAAFVKAGGIVCSCVFENGVFGFSFAETAEDTEKFCGSKYVKSTPYGIYKKIETALKIGKKVLFVGLPCQVAGVKNYLKNDQTQNLYTIDLICHGTPSPELLNVFLKQHNTDVTKIKKIQFREKGKGWLKTKAEYPGGKNIVDRYSMAFLNGISYTENCYKCRYAKLERVSDVTLGDSWGSSLSKQEQSEGISLILVQTEKGKELIGKANLQLYDVDLEKAVEHNHQLKAASHRPFNRDIFFKQLEDGKYFDMAVKVLYPRQCMRQEAKKILATLNIRLSNTRYNIACIDE